MPLRAALHSPNLLHCENRQTLTLERLYHSQEFYVLIPMKQQGPRGRYI